MKKTFTFLLAFIICATACKKMDTEPVTAITPGKTAAHFAREGKNPDYLYFEDLRSYDAFLATEDGALPANAPENFISLRSVLDEIDRLRNIDSAGYWSHPNLADTIYEGYGKLLDVLNQDKIVNLYGYLVRVELEKELVYTITGRTKDAYSILLSDPGNQNVRTYSTTDEVAHILAGFIAGCGDQAAPAKQGSPIQDYYCNSSNRTKKELKYQSAGIFFSLIAEAKNQKKIFPGIWVANGGITPIIYVNGLTFKLKCGATQPWWYGDASTWPVTSAYIGNPHHSSLRPYFGSTALTNFFFDVTIYGNCKVTWLQIHP